jgi:hypothetical protein
MRFWPGVRSLAGCMLVAGLLTPAGGQVAHAEDPIFVNWAEYLPSLTDTYNPNSANDCVAGRPRCIAAVIREMQRRFPPLGRSCNHNAIFSLAYLRTTQTFYWVQAQPDFFTDPPWVNHEAAVFAKYYFDAYDGWASGNRSQVPQAWLIAFDAAAGRRVTGFGNLMLGMNAHVNRDLPFTLAAIGITTPDGTSRKRDHDKVDEFLNMVIAPLLAEAAARFDQSADDFATPYEVSYTGLFQTLVAWRETAWRNAEALTDAPTPEARALVAQQIENDAAVQASAIVAANSYVPPVLTSAPRDAFCAGHNADPPPMSYAFGTASAY